MPGSSACSNSTTGSNGTHNLKGPNKLQHLRERFPGGFIYAGDGRADLPVFRAARGVVLCDVCGATAAAVAGPGVPGRSLRRPARGLRVWMRAFRLHQWAKNILLFVPLFVGHAYGDPRAIAAALLGFMLLCLLSSATYIINDLADLDADRQHATKRRRPFASGDIKILHGLIAAPLMIVGALVGALALSPPFAAALLAYLLLTSAYSFGLKRVPLLDVFIIGVLFTLRIVMGAEVASLAHSPWLLSFALAFFISLALSKRHGEVMRAARIDVGRDRRARLSRQRLADHAELRHRHRARVGRHHAALHDQRCGALGLLPPAGLALRDPGAADALADAHLAVEQPHAAA